MISKYSNPRNQSQNEPMPVATENSGTNAAVKDERIRVNGFAQVLEMLKIADHDFRISLLRRLAAKDAELARALKQELSSLGLM
jgi:hypothetical protein